MKSKSRICRETCNCIEGGGMARCMCVSCLCGREPVLSRSAGAAAAALLVLGAQMCPAAAQQCPQLSCQGRG